MGFYSGFEGSALGPALLTLPTDTSDLLGWGHSGSARWQDTGGTVAAGPGDVVARWDDASGLSHHLTQSNASSRPQCAGGVFAGRDMLLFDGVDDYLLSSAIGAALAGEDHACTFLCVYQRPLTGTQTLMSLASAASNNPFLDYRFGANRYDLLRRDNAQNLVSVPSSTPLNSGLHVACVRFDGTAVSLWQDLVLRVDQAACDVGTAAFTRFGLGAKVSLTLSQYLAGYLGEWMIWGRALSLVERVRQTYGLLGRWGIAP